MPKRNGRKFTLELVDGTLPEPGPKPYPDSFYEKVASTYRRLLALGVSPNMAMTEANSRARTTIDRWVRQARRKGFLGDTEKGVAGG